MAKPQSETLQQLSGKCTLSGSVCTLGQRQFPKRYTTLYRFDIFQKGGKNGKWKNQKVGQMGCGWEGWLVCAYFSPAEFLVSPAD